MKFSTKILFAFLVILAIPAYADLSASDKESLSFSPAKSEPVKAASLDQTALTVKPEVSDEVTEAAECELCRSASKPAKSALAKIPMNLIKNP